MTTAASRSRVGRDSAGLLVGTLVNGVFAYVFFVLVTRGLGATAAAPVAVLWTYWGMTMAVLTFPVQHWIIHAMRGQGEHAVAVALPRLSLAVAALATGATLVTWLADETLFLQSGPTFPVLVGLVTFGSFFTGVVRGGLSGRGRFMATAAALAADNVARVLLAVVVLRSGGGAVELGIVLVAGTLIGLAWPAGYRFQGATQAEEDVTSPLTILGAVAAGSLLGQVILVGGPAVLALLGGAPAQVTMLFATLSFFRAPYLLAVGLANRLTGTLTGWLQSQQVGHLLTFHRVVAAVTLGGAVLAALVAYIGGSDLVSIVFGKDSRPPELVAAAIAAGSVVAVGNLALAVLAITKGHGGRLTRPWVLGTVVVALVLVAMPLSPLLRVTWAFLAGETTAFGVLLWRSWSDTHAGVVGALPATDLSSRFSPDEAVGPAF